MCMFLTFFHRLTLKWNAYLFLTLSRGLSAIGACPVGQVTSCFQLILPVLLRFYPQRAGRQALVSSPGYAMEIMISQHAFHTENKT